MFKNLNYPSFFQAFILLVLFFALQMLGVLIIDAAGINMVYPQESTEMFVINIFIIPLLSGIIIIKYAQWRGIFGWSEIWGEKINSVTPYICVLVMFAGLSLVLSEVDNYVRYFIPMSDTWAEIFRNIYRVNIWLSLIGVVIIPSFLEEIIFRGIILRGFLKRYGVWMALLLSSFLFGLIHLNIWQMIPAFAAGFFLGWIYYRTGSLLIAVFAHAVFNMIAVTSNHYPLIPGFSDGASFQPAWLTFTGVFLIVVSMLLFYLSTPPESRFPGSKSVSS